jgi:hypothetical protein
MQQSFIERSHQEIEHLTVPNAARGGVLDCDGEVQSAVDDALCKK